MATITWDVAGKSVDVLSLATLDGLIDHALCTPAIRGVILTSGKADFAGGMDLKVIAQMRAGGARALFAGVMDMHRIGRKIERAGMDPKTLKGGKPIVAALPGTAHGIGLELPLACRRIIAADNPRARIGLPEIRVGIFPGAGGTTRLRRKLGVLAAAPFLPEGKLGDARAARINGLIDEVVHAADPVKPYDAKGYKMPGGTACHPAGFMTFVGASTMVTARTTGRYPAARVLMAAAYEGALAPFDAALRNERHGGSPRSCMKEALEKGANRPSVASAPVQHHDVLGAGMMGGHRPCHGSAR